MSTDTEGKTAARGSATRTANMQLRRERIIACARSMIAKDGFDAFRLKDLAMHAGVTVPTIHNLIGGREAVLKRLVETMIERVEGVQLVSRSDDPIDVVKAIIDQLVELFGDSEDFYRSAYVAGERLGMFGGTGATDIQAQSLQVAVEICLHAQERGYLSGRIAADQLGAVLFNSHRMARHDWVGGHIDLPTYRRRALAGAFIGLAADATPGFRERLFQEIEALDA